jgi:hypothetical protein
MCPPAERLAAMDEEIAWLVADDVVDGSAAEALLRLAREESAVAAGWDRMQALCWTLRSEATLMDWTRLAFRLAFSAEQLESLPPVLRCRVPGAERSGASPWELLDLGVHGFNAAGEDLPTLGGDELARRLLAVQRMASQGTTSAWLDGYARRLAAESRRRRGK